MSDIRLVDSDAHVVEPPRLWQDRVPPRYRSRAPRIEHFSFGDGWVIEGAPDPISFAANQIGGTPGGFHPELRREWIQWKDVPLGCYEPTARLEAMNEDGVSAALLYPSPRIGHAISWNNADKDFQVALFQAYNNWLSEFCSAAPQRLGGMAMMPTCGIAESVAEMRRAMQLPGIAGLVLTRWPAGGLNLSTDDDQFFTEAAANGIALNIHVSFVKEPVTKIKPDRLGFGADMPLQAKDLIYSGVFDRHPKLRVVWAEVDCGWVPYMRQQMDEQFKRLSPQSRPRVKMAPSEYFAHNIFFTFVRDSYAVQNRRLIGVENMMWSSDYPHVATNWPHSRTIIDEDFAGVSTDERFKILAGNAMNLYGIGERSEE